MALANPDTTGSSDLRWVLALLRWLPLLVLALVSVRSRWLDESALVTLRVVENVASGAGPVLNEGIRSEASTAPLWVWLLALLAVLTPWSTATLALVLGWLLAVVGLALALRATQALAHRRLPGVVTLPAGIVVMAATTPVAASLSSGRETGLAVCWVGISWWALTWTSGQTARGARTVLVTPIVIGLGPLISPSYLVITVVLLVVLCSYVAGWVGRAQALVLALVLPVGYQVFRMGYFGALLPTPLLAREPGRARWSDGAAYLSDTIVRYGLFVPLLVLAIVWCAGRPAAGATDAAGHHRDLLLVGGPVVAALLHWVVVAWTGGDSSHAVALVPGLLCLLLPVLVVPWVPALRPGRAVVLGWVVVLAWAAVASTQVRPEFSTTGTPAILDAPAHQLIRGQAVGWGGTEDLARMPAYAEGSAAQRLSERGAEGLLIGGDPLRPVSTGHGIVAFRGFAGSFGLAAPDLTVVDDLGEYDPVLSRLRHPADVAALPGHRFIVPEAWFLARYTTPALTDSSEVELARRALDCSHLGDIRRSTAQPLTVRLFAANVLSAWTTTFVGVPAAPALAVQTACKR